MGATHQSEHVTAVELRQALFGTIETLALRGSARRNSSGTFGP